jgi:hypothetical protein
MDTLFGHLAPQFTNQLENLATEALNYVLQRSAEARRLFIRFLEQSELSFDDDLTFSTQAVGETGSIPDLVGKDRTAAEVVIVEAKFWAGLTDRQPNAYLDRLPQSSGLLLFISPARRFETLWSELIRRCRLANRRIAADERKEPVWRSCRVDDGRRIALTSWRAVLEVLRTGLHLAGETATVSDLLQLQGLCDRMDANAFIPLTSEDLTSDLGTRIVQFCDLVDGAVDALLAEKLADSRGLRASGGRHALYGRFFRIHQTGCRLFFSALWWSRHGQPIFLEVRGSNWKPSHEVNAVLEPLGHETPPRLMVNQWGAYVPIYLSTGVERDAVLAEMSIQIHKIAELLKTVAPAGVAAGQPNPPAPDDIDSGIAPAS